MQRDLIAILYADVAGYSRLTGSDEDATHRRLNASLDLLTGIIAGRGGHKLHEAGDAVLAEFRSVTAAAGAAVEFQRQMSARNADLAEDSRLEFRVGVHLGEVIHDRGDIYGDDVNIAARIQDLAEPGGVCVSAAVHEQVRGKLDSVFDDLGHRKLKNIAHSVHVYRIRPAGPDDASHPTAFLASGVKGQPLFDLDGSAMKKDAVACGRCLCGAVRFEVTDQPIGTGYCHCRICQRSIGGPINAWVAFPRAAVRFTAGKPKYHDSTPIAQRGFCAECGSSLTYRLLQPERSAFLVINTVALDNPEDFAPTWHGGTESQLPWFDVHDELARMRSEDSPALRRAWESVGVPSPAEWKSRG